MIKKANDIVFLTFAGGFSLVLFIGAFFAFTEGKKELCLALIIISIMQFIIRYILYKGGNKNDRRDRK